MGDKARDDGEDQVPSWKAAKVTEINKDVEIVQRHSQRHGVENCSGGNVKKQRN